MSKLRKSVVDFIYDLGDHSGCHQMPERSFFWKGRQFPVCARCTGVVIGQFFALILGFFKNVPTAFSIICLSIMGFDWGIQEFNIKESNNIRRLITGFLGGFGLFSIYINAFKKILSLIKKFYFVKLQ